MPRVAATFVRRISDAKALAPFAAVAPVGEASPDEDFEAGVLGLAEDECEIVAGGVGAPEDSEGGLARAPPDEGGTEAPGSEPEEELEGAPLDGGSTTA